MARWQFVVPFIIVAMGWGASGAVEVVRLRSQLDQQPSLVDRRNREMDSLERRIAALEARCAQR